MCDGRKLLVAAIVFTALYYKVTAGREKLLDMAPDAVDDMYDGCRKEAMERFIHSGLLRQELNVSEGFQKAWSAPRACSKVMIPGGTKEHTAALLAYADEETGFSHIFDNAVETLGGNVSTYVNHFNYKSLHFLLMDSMLLLRPKKCKTVYVIKEDYTAQKGSKVRFGRFTKGQSTSSFLKKMEDWDGQIIFNITSCFFVNLDDICSEDQGMILLSPAEVFTVEAVNKLNDEVNESEYIEIILKHSRMDSSHNCYSFSRSPADVSSPWLVLMLLVLSLFLFSY